MKLLIRILLMILFFVFASGIFGQEKPIEKCKVDIEGGKYHLSGEGRQISEDFGIILLIVVDKKKFDRESMIQVAKRIKLEYCHDENINVIVFDSRKAATDGSFHWWNVEFSAGRNPRPPMRGFITYSSDPQKATLEYSLKLGEPTTQVQIDLSDADEEPTCTKPESAPDSEI